PNLRQSAGGVSTPCQQQLQPTPGGTPGAPMVPMFLLTCRGGRLSAAAETRRRTMRPPQPVPIADATGLSGTFDIDLRFSPSQLAAIGGGQSTTVFEAV